MDTWAQVRLASQLASLSTAGSLDTELWSSRPRTFKKSTIWGVTDNKGQTKHVFLIWEKWACGVGRGKVKGVGARRKLADRVGIRRLFPCS